MKRPKQLEYYIVCRIFDHSEEHCGLEGHMNYSVELSVTREEHMIILANLDIKWYFDTTSAKI